MKAFNGDQIYKNAILKKIEDQRQAGCLTKETYWDGGKVGALGCVIESLRQIGEWHNDAEHDNHQGVSEITGIPSMLWHLSDGIFDGLPDKDATLWPERFIKAAEPGSDLSRVGWKFLYWLLTDESVNAGINHPGVKDSVAKCAEIIGHAADGGHVFPDEAERRGDKAWLDGREAERTAKWYWCAMTWSPDSSKCASQWKVAWWSVQSAVMAAESLKTRNVGGPHSGLHAEAAGDFAARSTNKKECAYQKMADKLIELTKPIESVKGDK